MYHHWNQLRYAVMRKPSPRHRAKPGGYTQRITGYLIGTSASSGPDKWRKMSEKPVSSTGKVHTYRNVFEITNEVESNLICTKGSFLFTSIYMFTGVYQLYVWWIKTNPVINVALTFGACPCISHYEAGLFRNVVFHAAEMTASTPKHHERNVREISGFIGWSFIVPKRTNTPTRPRLRSIILPWHCSQSKPLLTSHNLYLQSLCSSATCHPTPCH